MAGINPVSGFVNPLQPQAPQPGGPSGASGSHASGDFAKVVQDAFHKIDADQQGAQFAIQDLLAGNTQDVLPAVSAMAKADLSFKLLLGVRNKVIEAYKQTMNMQV